MSGPTMRDPLNDVLEWSWTPTAAQLLRFSAVTWNAHLIHVSRDHARQYGLEDVVVHSQLPATVIATRCQAWLGSRWQLLEMTWQNRAPAYVDRALAMSATVVRADDDLWLDVQVRRPDGVLTLTGALRFRTAATGRQTNEEQDFGL